MVSNMAFAPVASDYSGLKSVHVFTYPLSLSLSNVQHSAVYDELLVAIHIQLHH